MKEQEQQKTEWKKVGIYGSGIILANGTDRRIVTEGKTDFIYTIKQEQTKEE
jgi:hypothetical protein